MLKPRTRPFSFSVCMLMLLACCSQQPRVSNAGGVSDPTALAIPGGAGGIGFDDLGFSAELHRVIVPAGRTGAIFLFDPAARKLDAIAGFSSQTSFAGGHGEGVTSADSGSGAIFAIDRNKETLDVIDPASKQIFAKAILSEAPDYVRYVRSTNEVWVTEPDASQMEIFALPEHGVGPLRPAAILKLDGGPESLVIDDTRGLAYTNLWSQTTLAIDLRKHNIIARWPNGCGLSRGIALDSTRGFLFVGCKEGKFESISLSDGHRIGEVRSGDGVDIIAYAPQLHHAYLPGADSATMAVIEISPSGKPTILTVVTTAKDSHCVTTDDLGNAYVCDPSKAQLLVFHDSLP